MQPIDVARQAARVGGEIVARYFREGIEVHRKETCDLVSEADVQAEHAIVEQIRKTFPQHAVLAEEAHQGEVDAEHLWVVDPLDGTNNFGHQIPHFAVSIAYYCDGVAQCGVIYNPITDDWYVAERGAGARHNERTLRVTGSTQLRDVMLGVGFYYDRGRMMEATLDAMRDLFHQDIHGIRRFGTASLDMAQVASGRYAAYFEYELSPWDYAAGQLLVEEAGGRVTRCRGEPVTLHKGTLLASNGHLHAAVQAIVERHHP